MARILIAWELGKGFGHLAPYLDLVSALQKKGHQVVFATRDVGHTEQLYGRTPTVILQAPMTMHTIRDPYKVQYSFTHLLHNIGFGDFNNLFGLVKAWRHIYHYVRPDIVLFDHSPTALLAARAYSWKRVISGSGFLVPPQTQPMPMMRYWQQYDPALLQKDEARLLDVINRVQQACKGKPLARVCELYDRDAEFLLSFKELDHYPQRQGGNYVGMFSQPGHGVAPKWVEGPQRRVFAYLHPYKDLPKLLEIFTRGKFATLVYGAEIQQSMMKKYESGNLRFSREPLDIARVAADVNFAVTNGTFGTTAAFLQHGKPVLAIPTNLERIMVARRLAGVGAGIAATSSNPESLVKAMRALFEDRKYTVAARKFQDRYGALDQPWQTARMVEGIEKLLESAGSAVKPGADRAPALPEPVPAPPADPAPRTVTRTSAAPRKKKSRKK